MKLKADRLAAKTWIYPLNKPKRDYQYNIVKSCLLENTLVALPTGLGKTFIAGVVMLNCEWGVLQYSICVSLMKHWQSTIGFHRARSYSLLQRNHSWLNRSMPVIKRVGSLVALLPN